MQNSKISVMFFMLFTAINTNAYIEEDVPLNLDDWNPPSFSQIAKKVYNRIMKFKDNKDNGDDKKNAKKSEPIKSTVKVKKDEQIIDSIIEEKKEELIEKAEKIKEEKKKKSSYGHDTPESWLDSLDEQQSQTAPITIIKSEFSDVTTMNQISSYMTCKNIGIGIVGTICVVLFIISRNKG